MGALDVLRQCSPDAAGISQRLTYDEANELVVVHSVQDVEPLLKANKARLHAAETGNKGYSPSRDLKEVAEIPNIIVHQWMQKGLNIFDDEDWATIAGMLDSQEYSALRTGPGVISRKSRREYPTTRG